MERTIYIIGKTERMLFFRSQLFKKPAYSMTLVSSGYIEPSHFHEALHGLFYA